MLVWRNSTLVLLLLLWAIHSPPCDKCSAQTKRKGAAEGHTFFYLLAKSSVGETSQVNRLILTWTVDGAVSQVNSLIQINPPLHYNAPRMQTQPLLAHTHAICLLFVEDCEVCSDDFHNVSFELHVLKKNRPVSRL